MEEFKRYSFSVAPNLNNTPNSPYVDAPGKVKPKVSVVADNGKKRHPKPQPRSISPLMLFVSVVMLTIMVAAVFVILSREAQISKLKSEYNSIVAETEEIRVETDKAKADAARIAAAVELPAVEDEGLDGSGATYDVSSEAGE